MSNPITDLGDLICQHVTVCYASGEKRALTKLAKEMGATFEQIVAASLAQRIAEKFQVLPKSEGNPPMEGRTLVE